VEPLVSENIESSVLNLEDNIDTKADWGFHSNTSFQAVTKDSVVQPYIKIDAL
jgi:hypothetical protein